MLARADVLGPTGYLITASALTGAPSPNARRMIPGDDSPPAADSSSHCAPTTAASAAPGAARAGSTSASHIAAAPITVNASRLTATRRRNGPAIWPRRPS